ncbi:MAG: SurA N-terminal domain-containing protein [Endomicrobium sp.]|jgi:hypothetical protein|nr:SurA N-terminal domain-containing protein [Endomicrobium sp.]
MINFSKKYFRIFFIITVFCFICGIFLSVIPYFLKHDFIIKINESKIPSKLYQILLENSLKIQQYNTKNNQLSKKDIEKIKISIINKLIVEEILYQQSKTYGVIISDYELINDLKNNTIFNDNNTFNKIKYINFLKLINITPKEYESLRRKQLAAEKTKKIIESSIKLWSQELKNENYNNTKNTEEFLLKIKKNQIISEWYSSIINESNIIINNSMY